MVKLVFITPNATDIIAYAARFSTATQEENLQTQQEKDNTALVKKLIKRGHFACLEFADAMFEIECSRACSHQIVRHRHFSYVQESQRFVKFDDAASVIDTCITPDKVKENADIDLDYVDVLIDLKNFYNNLIDSGIPKEDARYILPNACKTRLVMKGNFRSWIEFLQKRLVKQAQWEIRKMAEEIRDILTKECPVVFENIDFRELR